MVKLIAFDMDGTLTDSRKMITAFINKTIAHYGRPPLPDETILRYVGLGAKYLLHETMRESGFSAPIEEIYGYYDALYKDIPAGLVAPFPGVAELLKALGDRGIIRMVLSNRPHTQTVKVIADVLPGLVDETYGQRDGIPMKPDPAALNQILAERNVAREDCMYVGDMQYDIEHARNAGVTAVGCVWGLGKEEDLLGADHLLKKPLEILDLI